MKLGDSSALNLDIKGTVGTFRVGDLQEKNSLEVKYVLTHLSLDFAGGVEAQLLDELAPVREIFDSNSLNFDEIMQRDIDDARVSSKLIPYILEESASDRIKFFPPIVVVLLPLEDGGQKKPGKVYPEVTALQEKGSEVDQANDIEAWWAVQSGTVGEEVFKFKQPMVNGKPLSHDLCQLSVNTKKACFVIVDGQHRAMALLALYRNMREGWADSNRAPFKNFYKEWAASHIEKFNLEKVALPMIICTVPGLDTSYQAEGGEYDLRKASRAIFLTLNKTARKVSKARQYLLDDADIVSSVLRASLSAVKNKDTPYLLPDSKLTIHNFELDQSGDQRVIQSPMAFSGVTHLHYIIEHLLLNDDDVKGVSRRSGAFGKRRTGTYFQKTLDRLDCEDKLGSQALESINRHSFNNENEEVLIEQFMERYGRYILKTFSEIKLFTFHSKATEISESETLKMFDQSVNRLLFGGQGTFGVFQEHKKALEERLKAGDFITTKEDITKQLIDISASVERYDEAVAAFKSNRYGHFFAGWKAADWKQDASSQAPADLAKKVVDIVYEKATTVAFQAALICGFFNEYEKASKSFFGELDLKLDIEFDAYLKSINDFFTPTAKTFAKNKHLIELFLGRVPQGVRKLSTGRYEASACTFHDMVVVGDLTPDDWPKYRYLFLEIWQPDSPDFQKRIESEKEKCRLEVFSAVHKKRQGEYFKSANVSESDADPADLSNVKIKALDDFNQMLKALTRASRKMNWTP
jgi:hypothetical protein